MTASSVFVSETEVVSELGCLGTLRSVVDRLSVKRVAIVCDQGVANAGLLDLVLDALGPLHPVAQLFTDPDPSIADAEQASCRAREQGADSVLAVGGGSGLALGKAVAVGLGSGRPISGLASAENPASAGPVPTVAIPTTAGSGSEVSSVFVLRDPGSPAALVVRGRGYAPRLALLDATLLSSLPRDPMIFAALDSLSHSLEALWARAASSFTDALAKAAAERVFAVLLACVRDRDPRSLQMLLEASAMANLACGNSGLGLVHALSIATAVRLPHGYQNGVLLPAVAAFNYPFVSHDIQALIDRLAPLYDQIEFRPRFARDDLDGTMVDAMVDVALTSPLHMNNVRHAGRQDLCEILVRAGAPVSESKQLTVRD